MTVELAGLLADVRDATASARAGLAALLRDRAPAGCVLLETCHRVELYGPRPAIEPLLGLGNARLVDEPALVRHVVSLAVGRESAVVGEDQVLHQLREAVSAARARGPLPATLDRLLDRALRAGRRARTWLPAHRRSLADEALDAAARVAGPRSGPVLVVGAGRMGALAAKAARARRHDVVVASRTSAHAAALAGRVGARTADFVPAPARLEPLAGVVVALAGPWPVGRAEEAALVASGAWLVDLSSPPAVPPGLAARLAGRLLTVDDLASRPDHAAPELAARLDRLVDETVTEHEQWVAAEGRRTAARALADRARVVRDAELEALWRRVPSIDPAARDAVEAMASRLAERLIQDPLERLHADVDGRRETAARELFGL